ncbi:D-Ala-D-Ala carboxypeptidase family metallohydrolase [Spirulina sp. 06S082]|uniref:D-Ala-D-Ala carboxypeptidase family metallohydrolase n=1 Tax=Spirulina sp. 06S082 TaxID=3110248 RepID=UPI002B21A2C5|nr:D-Ala-D-Ala carboxypeptidase family metallohydrolase [Spirulina sp. 06S082]MEA5469299.1 D-Ala-D-Ala carboxypeptidase family metallohydrolase [Spirulina sp. 06S082]
MAELTPDRRNYHYLIEAERTGIHKPILAALYRVHRAPILTDGETGLGVSADDKLDRDRLDTFPEQVQYAANLIRILTDDLVAQKWQNDDLWNGTKGRYSDRLVEVIAGGYLPQLAEGAMGQLLPCDGDRLLQAYENDIATDYEGRYIPQNLANLDRQLLDLIERISEYYSGLSHQREALLAAVRIWRRLDTVDAAIASLARDEKVPAAQLQADRLDVALKQFIQRLSPNYSGYPHQREALLRLTQYWRQLPTREDAIDSLEKATNPDPGLQVFDASLLNFVQRLPRYYEGKGSQRNAVTECFRLWRQIDSRGSALTALGIDPEILTASTASPETIKKVAVQLDRELLNFVRRIPGAYSENHQQREALIRMVQLWRGLKTRSAALASLIEDTKRLEKERADEKDKPTILLPDRPDRWTRQNIQLSATILPNGNFTWAEATKGGTRMPPDDATLNAMIRIANLAQQARDRVGRPFIITSWYRPPHINRAVGGAKYSRHIVGDAIDFVCDNLTGNQLYWLLDPWWPGGLGRYLKYPNLCHIDARNYRARWHY